MFKISVCLASFNGELYLLEQVNSILAQLRKEDELIISDDNSSDSTLSLIESLNDKRIKIFVNTKKGLINNFENALCRAQGDYVFLADQDDIWKHNKVEECMKNFQEGYNLILSDCEVFDSSTGEIIEPSFFKFNGSRRGIKNNLIHNSYIGCCMAFDRKVLELALPFPKNIPMHDSWIGLLAELKYRVKFSDKKLISYRVHENNVSATGSGKSQYSFFKKLSFRWNLFIPLVGRALR